MSRELRTAEEIYFVMKNNIATGKHVMGIFSERKLNSPKNERIQQSVHEIYVGRGGVERMALGDWLKAERELNRKLKG